MADLDKRNVKFISSQFLRVLLNFGSVLKILEQNYDRYSVSQEDTFRKNIAAGKLQSARMLQKKILQYKRLQAGRVRSE